MALSYVLYTNQTGTGPFNFTFPYISTAHVKVEKNGTVLTLGTHYTLSTSPTPQITLTAALVATDTLRIFRETPGRAAAPNNVPLVDFTDGSVLTAADLDKNTQQLLYLVQESDDTGSGALGPTLDDLNWDAVSKQIKNVAVPTANSDAVNKQYVDTLALYGVNQASGQAWDLVGDGTSQYQLIGPVPSAADPELFFVEVGGALQHPGTNYSITQSGGNYYLQLSENVSSPTKIRVRNLGVSRGTIAGSTVTIDDSTFSVDMANNRVGIGTTTPKSDLNIHSSTVGSRIQLTNTTTGNAAAGDGLAVETSGNNGYLWNYENGALQFGTFNTTRLTILGDGKVGIGTTAPVTPLTVRAATADVRTETTGDLTSTGQAYFSIYGSNGNSGYVGFGGAASTLDVVNRLNGPVRFHANNAEAARITSTGNLAIGRTDAPVPITIKNNAAANTNTSDNVANQVRLWDATDAVYGFGVSTGSLNISANQGSTGEISFWTGGTDSVAPANRLTIPSGSAGIRFPATPALSSNANTLDDYREGTWTPTLVYYSRNLVGGVAENIFRNFPAITYGTQSGRYTKIGSLVYVNFAFATNAVTLPAGHAANWYVAIANLPFAADNHNSLSVGYVTGWTTSSPYAGYTVTSQPTTGTADVGKGLMYLLSSTYTYLSPANVTTTGASTNVIYGSFSYRTAE
jgi:hypothetical protein